jgi:hypothetical protein
MAGEPAPSSCLTNMGVGGGNTELEASLLGSPFTSGSAATHRSYLEALLLPGKPAAPSPAKRTPMRSSEGNCFRPCAVTPSTARVVAALGSRSASAPCRVLSAPFAPPRLRRRPPRLHHRPPMRVILLVDVGDQRSLCVVNDQPVGNPKRKV